MSRLLQLLMVALLALIPIGPDGVVRAQDQLMPGVRGTLYESPSRGWILSARPYSEATGSWQFADAASVGGMDSVHLVGNVGDGPAAYFLSTLDDGRGVAGCMQDLIDNLATSFNPSPLQEVTGLAEPSPAWDFRQVRVVRSIGEGLDILADLSCRARPDDTLIIASAHLSTERDTPVAQALPALSPWWPGEGHTARPRSGHDDPVPDNGVVRFSAGPWSPESGPHPFPFTCLWEEQQADLPLPADPPPIGDGMPAPARSRTSTRFRRPSIWVTSSLAASFCQVSTILALMARAVQPSQ